jgi:hypothetical protein
MGDRLVQVLIAFACLAGGCQRGAVVTSPPRVVVESPCPEVDEVARACEAGVGAACVKRGERCLRTEDAPAGLRREWASRGCVAWSLALRPGTVIDRPREAAAPLIRAVRQACDGLGDDVVGCLACRTALRIAGDAANATWCGRSPRSVEFIPCGWWEAALATDRGDAAGREEVYELACWAGDADSCAAAGWALADRGGRSPLTPAELFDEGCEQGGSAWACFGSATYAGTIEVAGERLGRACDGEVAAACLQLARILRDGALPVDEDRARALEERASGIVDRCGGLGCDW